jgi:hypothetical protein
MILIFSKIEKSILHELCDIQISSYRDILESQLLKEDENILLCYNSSLEAAEREAKWRISQYQEVKALPNYLGILEDSEISTLRHILFHMEDTYIQEGLEKHVRSLWSKFFEIEASRKPSLKSIKKITDEKKKSITNPTTGHFREVIKDSISSLEGRRTTTRIQKG